jgi:hypothetical protein
MCFAPGWSESFPKHSLLTPERGAVSFFKLVLSRKGFDASYGGMPSPILPDGRLVPLPIPTRHDADTLQDLCTGDIDVGNLASDLSQGRWNAGTVVHLDPDLHREPRRRREGWRPALGQTGSAQSHLEQQGVNVGDVFLFFGWFREVALRDGCWRYVPRAPHLHVIFGWLEIDDVLRVVEKRSECIERYPWIIDHPHVRSPEHYTDPRNTLYVARPSSSYTDHERLGGGRFYRYSPELQLTRAGSSRSLWSLPAWFMPNGDRPPLSYHGSQSRWQQDGSRVTLQTVAKGQEFVMHTSTYPEATDWIRAVIRSGVRQ